MIPLTERILARLGAPRWLWICLGSDTLLGGAPGSGRSMRRATFDYECTIRPGMVGRVSVTEG